MKTSKLLFSVVAAMFLVVAGFSARSEARVNVNVGINLPLFSFSAPPPLVVIPGTYAYFAPDADVDIVFYQGFWYRPYEGRWFRSRGYNGPWGYIAPGRVPGVLLEISPDFRHRYHDRGRIEYRDFKRNWKRWDRNKHWDRDEHWREGLRLDRREDRRERREEHRDRGRR